MTTAAAISSELSSLDATFWALESRQHPMHLGALLRFGPGAGPARALADLLAARAARSSRLRQWVHVPGSPLAAPRWVEDPDFDARAHVFVHDTVRPDALPQFAAALMAEPLDPGLPPWQIHLLCDGAPNEGFTLLLKLHHAAVDGLRAVELAVRLFDRLPSRTHLAGPAPASTPETATRAGAETAAGAGPEPGATGRRGGGRAGAARPTTEAAGAGGSGAAVGAAVRPEPEPTLGVSPEAGASAAGGSRPAGA